jgi:hypothetical protein
MIGVVVALGIVVWFSRTALRNWTNPWVWGACGVGLVPHRGLLLESCPTGDLPPAERSDQFCRGGHCVWCGSQSTSGVSGLRVRSSRIWGLIEGTERRSRVGKALGDARAVGSVGDLLTERGEVVLADRVLDVDEQLGAFAHEVASFDTRPAAATQDERKLGATDRGRARRCRRDTQASPLYYCADRTRDWYDCPTGLR